MSLYRFIAGIFILSIITCLSSCSDDSAEPENEEYIILPCGNDYVSLKDIMVIPTKISDHVILIPEGTVGDFPEQPTLAFFISDVAFRDKNRTFDPADYLNRPILVSGAIHESAIPVELEINGEKVSYAKHFMIVTDFNPCIPDTDSK